jgi:hypothetical protein
MPAKVKAIVFLLFLLSGTAVPAQDVQFVGSARSSVAQGETFTLSYTVNAQGTGFRGPNLGNFYILSGPNTSTTSSIRSVNGRTTMSMTYTYTYYLQANREGTFELEPANITVDGKNYKSNPLTIRVVKGASSGSGQQQPQNQAPPRNQQQNQGSDQVSPNDVFLKAVVNNSNPYQGEGILLTFKLYTKIPIAQVATNLNSTALVSSPYQGFWSQSLTKDNSKFNQSKQTIDGQQYVVADIYSVVLYPVKSGKLVIDPREVECVAQVKTKAKSRTGDPFFDDFFNDPFFNNSVATVEKILKSNPVTVNVRPLPEDSKPDDFSGAVGSFSFNPSLDKNKVKTNEPVNLKLTVSGQGNIQLIDKMDIAFPPDFDTYDPKITSDIKTTSAGVSGSQSFEYLMIPRKPGKFTVKPVSFSYFDLSKKKYITFTSPSYEIEVEKGSGDNAGGVVYSNIGKEDIKYIGSDIRFIRNQAFVLHRTGELFLGSVPFFLFLILPVVMFILFIILWKRRTERRSDTVLMKNRKATKVARKRLHKAQDSLKAGKEEEFYEDLSQALWGYLSDKYGIPLSELSIDSVSSTLTGKNVSGEIIGQFVQTLNNTEFARFAPGEKSLKMEKLYNEALEVITKNERSHR